ncbi:MAG: 23S rRNA (guanosine(2251)-2'-O)-methyltransferase RlmB [Bacilli bacterium]
MFSIIGRNAAIESLNANRVNCLYLVIGFKDERILNLAKVKNIKINYVEKSVLDSMAHKGVHQGVVADVKPFKTYSLTDLIYSRSNDKKSVIVMLDELNDPHNLGAILRSCDIFDVTGIVYKKRGQVSLNDTVAKTSAGAINYVKCCEVTNLSQSIETLKKAGYWVVGLAGEATQDLKSMPNDVPLVVVIGSEGNGISRLVREHCDFLVKIPMFGHVNCLNASVACSIVLYQIRNK